MKPGSGDFIFRMKVQVLLPFALFASIMVAQADADAEPHHGKRAAEPQFYRAGGSVSPGSARGRGTAGFGPASTTFSGRGSTGGARGRLNYNFGKRSAEPHGHGKRDAEPQSFRTSGSVSPGSVGGRANGGFGPFRAGGSLSPSSGRARGNADFGPFRVSGGGGTGSSGSAGVRGTAGFGPLSTTFNGRGSTGGAGGRLGFNFGKREAEPHHG